MHNTTEAVVLQLYPYKDNNAVVKLYSKDMGFISCWAASIHKKKSKTKANLLQPLSIIKAEVSTKGSDNLVQLKEIEISVHTPGIVLNIEKSTIAMFLAELLLKSLKESSSDNSLYEFIKEAILLLDKTKERCINFHVLFIIRLSDYFGLLPKGNYSVSTSYYNLQDGIYQATAPLHPHFLNPVESEWLSRLSSQSLEKFHEVVIPSSSRKLLLRGLLEYFELHLAMSPLKSHLILEEVF
ncbi:MAG TPA: DNA repair protein RecO [Bacteroidia bacterium]|jgi:DNA repair protein RecO (recombination protein O)|nr:DNA repair protein RecO [Bacteroidia bacterium]